MLIVQFSAMVEVWQLWHSQEIYFTISSCNVATCKALTSTTPIRQSHLHPQLVHSAFILLSLQVLVDGNRKSDCHSTASEPTAISCDESDNCPKIANFSIIRLILDMLNEGYTAVHFWNELAIILSCVIFSM